MKKKSPNLNQSQKPSPRNKWAQKVDLKEGELTKIGWPNPGSIVLAVKNGKVPYATAVQRLNYLANVSKDKATVTKAKAIIVRLQKEFRDKSKK